MNSDLCYAPKQALELLFENWPRSLEQDLISHTFSNQELTLIVQASSILKILKILKEDPSFGFSMLIDICGVDYPERDKRFDLVYHLLSMSLNLRIRVKLSTDEKTPIYSVMSLYPNANWYEREIFDMYGVLFNEHTDLRRILTDYGFSGHPLRKDFPLTGYLEVRYDPERKRVISEPVKLTQEFRQFDFLSPWEGAETEAGFSKKDDGKK